MGLGRDGTSHGTDESRSCPFPLSRLVSRKAGKRIPEGKIHISDKILQFFNYLDGLEKEGAVKESSVYVFVR